MKATVCQFLREEDAWAWAAWLLISGPCVMYCAGKSANWLGLRLMRFMARYLD